MSKVVVLGVEGEDGLWLADFEAGTLTKIDDVADGAFGFAARARASGQSLVKGISFAVATNSGEDPAGGHLDRGLLGAPRIEGLDIAVAADTGGNLASGHYDRGPEQDPLMRGVYLAVAANSASNVSGGLFDRGPE